MVSNYLVAKAASRVMSRRVAGTVAKAGVKYAPYLAGAARAAGRYFSRNSSSNGKKGITVSGVTNQHDEKMIYRKKRMPKGKRKAWKKFTKKVKAVEIKDRGLQVIMYEGTKSVTATGGSANWLAAHFYGEGAGLTSAKEVGLSDLQQLGKHANLVNEKYTNANIGGNNNFRTLDTSNVARRNDIRMQSAQIDVTLTNTGTNAVCVVIYHLWYVSDTDVYGIDNALAASQESPIQLTNGFNSTLPDLTAVAPSQYDWKLFNQPGLISKLGCTVRSMKEVYLSPGQYHRMNIRDPRNYNISIDSVNNQTGVTFHTFSNVKRTESLFFHVKAPGGDSTVSMKATRTYRYTVEGVRTVQTGYVNNID